MQSGAGSTQPAVQQTVILSVNGKAVANAAELQTSLDVLAPGAAVKLAYKSKGADRLIEGLVK
jgi:S1-C subfamily serine protease